MYKSNSGLGLNPNHYCSYISILLTEKLICVNPLLLLYLPLAVILGRHRIKEWNDTNTLNNFTTSAWLTMTC